jgi:hypothetical protein
MKRVSQGLIFLIAPMEAASSTSTVALRDEGGDEKRTQCLGV